MCRFEVRLELQDGTNARLIFSLPPLSPSHPPTPPPSRWPALTTLPPLAKFQVVWRRLCEALLSSSSLAGQKHPSLLSRLVLKCRKYKGRFPLIMNIKSSICGHSGCAHSHVRSLNTTDHRRRADRAPQIRASFTRDRRRAQWHM